MHTPLLSRQDTYQLNHLIGQALSKPELQRRILNHDPQLIIEFALPQSVWWLITRIQTQSLNDFCKQLVTLEHDS